MTAVEVKVPQFSESAEEGTLTFWKKKSSETMAQDGVLIEVETDKVVLGVPALSVGVLAEVLITDGATVASEQLSAKIDTKGRAGVAASAAATPALTAAAPAPAAAAPAAVAAGGVMMPLAAKLMAKNNLPTGQVAGMGRDGRTIKGDVPGVMAGGAKPAAVAAPRAARPALQ